MSKGTNLQIVIGNLGKDPEIRHTQSGATVATLTVATSDSRKDKTTGEWIEEVEWHRVVLWNRLADLAEKYLRKGRQVYVRGRKKTRTWTGDDGRKNYIVELIADDMQLLGGKGQDTPADAPTHQSQDSTSQNTAPNPLQAGDPGHFDDDVPL